MDLFEEPQGNEELNKAAASWFSVADNLSDRTAYFQAVEYCTYLWIFSPKKEWFSIHGYSCPSLFQKK